MATENISTTTGIRVFVAGASSASTEAEFEALTFTEIKGINDIGTFGDKREEITSETFGEGRRIKRSGVRDAGTMTLKVHRDSFDPGQRIARAGFEGGKPHAFKVVLDDQPVTANGTSGTPTTYYVLGVILSKEVEIGGPNAFVYQTFEVSLTSAPVELEAAA